MSHAPSKITAVLTARPGKSDELKALLVGIAPLCRADSGNLRWDIWRDPSHLGLFVLDELYRDAAAVEAHRNSPHYQVYLTKIPELADRNAYILEALDVI